MAREEKIYLPTYHPKQALFVNSPAKRKVICAGRRGGKTTAAAGVAVDSALDGKRVLEAAPRTDQTSAFWDNCKRFLRDPIDAGDIYKNETDRVLELPGGGRIKAKTAWDADTLRSDYADLLILDEFSLMKETAWSEVGAPMLMDNNGDAIFIFTPKRKNHAYKLFNRAIADSSGRWESWSFTSYDNPHLSQEALAEITEDMSEDAYKQEILAEFLDSQGQVFRNIDACLTSEPTKPDEHTGHYVVCGVDWGKSVDSTFISVFCVDCNREVFIDRFNKVDYHLQRKRLNNIYNLWGVDRVLAESNAMGQPVIDELIRDGLAVTGFQTTATSKPPLIESLVLCFERQEGRWIDDPVCTSELESYEMKMSVNTGRPTYSAPPGMHDDTVIGRALSWRAANATKLDWGFY